MRASRAYIASLGTAGVLLASTLLLLVVVGALVSFHGWPREGSAGKGEALELGDGRRLMEIDPVAFGEGSGGVPGKRVAVRRDRGVPSGQRQAGKGLASSRVERAQGAVGGGVGGGGAATGVGARPEGLSGATEAVTRGAGEALGHVNGELGRGVVVAGGALGQAEAELPMQPPLP